MKRKKEKRINKKLREVRKGRIRKETERGGEQVKKTK